MNQIPNAAKYLNLQERKMLMKKDNAKAVFEIVFHWSIIFLAFTLIHFFPVWYVILPCLFLIGGGQLACAVLSHDSSHHAVFDSNKWNDFFGSYFGAYPVFNSMLSYRPYHQIHHITNGTVEDPDILLTRGYPTTRVSMARKMFRDLFAITGIKSLIALIAMQLGIIKYTQSGAIEKIEKSEREINWEGVIGPLVTNLVLVLLLYVFLDPRLYIYWMIAYLTTFQFSVRIRSIAEHSVVEDRLDPDRNTRTTKANFLERLIFAPYHVNYHLEHHMLMTVPSYNLPIMHKLLVERGYYEKGLMSNGYWEIIRMACSK